MKKNIRPIWVFVGMGLFLNGCMSKGQAVVTIEQEPYEKISYQTVQVEKGDLNPSVTLTLNVEGYEQIQYSATNPELELDKVYVSVGDRVEKGDILVSFKSDSIQQAIEDYEDEKRQNQLLVEHYQKLMSVDAYADYRSDISMLQGDIVVAQLYIEEAKNKLEDYQIVAKESGTITKISESLRDGYFVPGKNLLTEVCGNGNYSTSTKSTDAFAIGETYTAVAGVASYELRLTDITGQVLTFEPISDMSSVSEADELILTVEKPQLKDVLYVDADAVRSVGGDEDVPETYYVFRVKENGYREAVSVTVGDRVNKYIVITQGLNEGEKVTLN